MASEDWLGVQLVIWWVGLLAVAFFAFIVVVFLAGLLGPASETWLAVGLVVVWIALAVDGIVVTWRWFGSRKHSRARRR